jgi:hypothetical protein
MGHAVGAGLLVEVPLNRSAYLELAGVLRCAQDDTSEALTVSVSLRLLVKALPRS